MTDKNGTPVTVGAMCRFYSGTRDTWRDGTVRRVAERTYYRPTVTMWEALVDDGDPTNEELGRNGFTCAAWVEGKELEIVTGGSP